VTRFERAMTQRLWSSPVRDLRSVVAFQARSYARGTWLVRAFYAGGIVLLAMQMGQWDAYLDLTEASPQWPAGWMSRIDLQTAIRLLLVGYLLATLWAAIAPEWRLARLASFLMLLQFVAFINGFGKINHGYHSWLWVSAVFVFLPDRRWIGRTRVAERHRFLTVIWSAQVVVLFFYSLTGGWKVYWAVRDLFAPDRMSSFELDGFSYIVGERILATNQETVLGELLVQNPAVGWSLFVGTMYLEAASLLIAFRPRLHRVWGLGLIGFHIGTQLAMGFTFTRNILLVGLLFLCSPYAPEEVSVRAAMLDLPGVHVWVRRRARRRMRSQVAQN
jgi:hypothetical protein